MELETKNGENRVLVSHDQRSSLDSGESPRREIQMVFCRAEAAPSRKADLPMDHPSPPINLTPFPPMGRLGPSRPI